MIEPGDVVDVYMGDFAMTEADPEFAPALVVGIDGSPDGRLVTRWLDNGRDSVTLARTCRILIKRYHVLVGMSISELEVLLGRTAVVP